MASKEMSVRQNIANALMDLMTEKMYMDITVTEIVNTAQVARASFYRNFNSVSDVIDYVIDDLSHEFMEDILPALTSRDERRWREFLFEYFYRFSRNQRKMAAIHSKNAAVLFSRMDQKMQLQEKLLPKTTLHEKYTAFGKMGLINNIAKKWMDDGMQETPEEMINYIMTFITSF